LGATVSASQNTPLPTDGTALDSRRAPWVKELGRTRMVNRCAVPPAGSRILRESASAAAVVRHSRGAARTADARARPNSGSAASAVQRLRFQVARRCLLARLLRAIRAPTHRALRTLTPSELVFEQALYPEPEYAFKHPLTQEVGYRTQLAARRAETHHRVAQAILECSGEAVDDQSALLAHHFDAAGAEMEAMQWSERAARYIGRSDQRAALRFWRRVRELAGRRPEEPAARRTQLRACTPILNVFWRLGDPEGEADAIFEEGRAIAEREGDRRRLANLRLCFGGVLGLQRGDRAGRIEQATEALRLAREGRDPRAELIALAQLSVAQLSDTRPRQALATADAALAFPEEVNRSFLLRPATTARTVRAVSLAELGRIAEASAEASRALEIARRADEHEELVNAWAMSADVAWLAGGLDKALAHAHSAIEVSQRASSSGAALSRAHATIASVLIEQARGAEAIPALEAGLPVAVGLRGFILSLLARVRLEMGDAEGARLRVAEVLAASAQARPAYAARTHCVLAQLLLRAEGSAAREAIEAELARADAIIEDTGARVFAPFVTVERAALARALGDKAGYERQLQEAQRLWLAMGATGWAERVAQGLGQKPQPTRAGSA